MLAFIYKYKSFLILLGIIILLYSFYLFVKKMPTKVTKTSKKTTKKDDSKTVEQSDKGEGFQTEKSDQVNTSSDEKAQAEDDKTKNKDKKPKIVQIYKSTERKDESGLNSKEEFDPIYNRNVEFVNTSKNIAKFKSFAENKPEESQESLEKKDEFGFVEDEKEDCEFCEDKVKHFDHSKRLSSIMKDGEDIFNSHISDKYMNINSDRHISVSKIEESLMKRTEMMMKNSEEKVNCNCNHDDHNHSECEVCEDLHDDVRVDMKTALIAETYFKRKSRR